MHDDLQTAHQSELAPVSTAPSNAAAKPTAKFRNIDNPSQTWAGRGKRPNWLKAKLAAGHHLEDFRIRD